MWSGLGCGLPQPSPHLLQIPFQGDQEDIHDTHASVESLAEFIPKFVSIPPSPTVPRMAILHTNEVERASKRPKLVVHASGGMNRVKKASKPPKIVILTKGTPKRPEILIHMNGKRLSDVNYQLSFFQRENNIYFQPLLFLAFRCSCSDQRNIPRETWCTASRRAPTSH
jgi:hypothetical protein